MLDFSGAKEIRAAACPSCGLPNICKFSMTSLDELAEAMHTDFYMCYGCRRHFTTNSTEFRSALREQVPSKHGSHDKWRIPPEKRTRPMSLSEAALLMGYQGTKKQTAKRLRRLIDDRSIHYERFSRQLYVFNKDDFCLDVWPRLAPLRPISH